MQFDHLIRGHPVHAERGKKIFSKIILRAQSSRTACESGQKLYFRVEALS